jgi:nucleoid-associated protein YgaU
MKNIILIIMISGLLAGAVCAQSTPVTEDLMKIGVGARPMGMGKAFVALADDGNSPFMNPAGLAELKTWQLTSMYVNYLEGDVPYTLLSGSWPWRAGNIGLGLLSTGVSDIPSPTPTSISYFDYYDRMLFLTYAQRYAGMDILNDPNKDLLFGGNLKLLFKGMGGAGGNAGRGYDVDLGVKYTHNKWLKFGANFQNILATTLDWNSQAKDDIPLLLKVGGAVKLWNERLNLALDMDLPLGANLPNLYHLGVEWPINSVFCLRAGADQISDATSAVATNPTAGASINYRGFKVDYAYHPYQGTLNDLAHYFSFSYQGDESKKAEPAAVTPAKMIEQLEPVLKEVILPTPVKKLIESQAEKPVPVKVRYHYTSRGDTYTKLAKKYYGSADYAEALRDYNGSKTGLTRSLSNQVISIPPAKELEAEGKIEEAPPPPPPQPEVIKATPEALPLPPATTEVRTGGPPKKLFHFISESDTLIGLSIKYYGISDYYLKLARVNNIKPPYNLSPGRYILIPTEQELIDMMEE